MSQAQGSSNSQLIKTASSKSGICKSALSKYSRDGSYNARSTSNGRACCKIKDEYPSNLKVVGMGPIQPGKKADKLWKDINLVKSTFNDRVPEKIVTRNQK